MVPLFGTPTSRKSEAVALRGGGAGGAGGALGPLRAEAVLAVGLPELGEVQEQFAILGADLDGVRVQNLGDVAAHGVDDVAVFQRGEGRLAERGDVRVAAEIEAREFQAKR